MAANETGATHSTIHAPNVQTLASTFQSPDTPSPPRPPSPPHPVHPISPRILLSSPHKLQPGITFVSWHPIIRGGRAVIGGQCHRNDGTSRNPTHTLIRESAIGQTTLSSQLQRNTHTCPAREKGKDPQLLLILHFIK